MRTLGFKELKLLKNETTDYNDDEIRVSNQNQVLFMILQNKEDEHMLLFWLLHRLSRFLFLTT